MSPNREIHDAMKSESFRQGLLLASMIQSRMVGPSVGTAALRGFIRRLQARQ